MTCVPLDVWSAAIEHEKSSVCAYGYACIDLNFRCENDVERNDSVGGAFPCVATKKKWNV
jgi:hypothetical protein